MGLSEFLKMYKHRYGSCAEDTKVDMLGEYLAGEAKRVYKSILSSWDGRSSITFDELESGMKNLMLDNSRTGMLLKQQRVHGLRMKEDESYLSFITFLETKVCEAYGDESYSIVDGVKIQVLLRNIRDPTLALQVEQALRSVPMGSPLFPTAKDLVIAYERTAKQARQWTGNPGSVFNRSHGKVSGRSKFQGNSSNQEKPDSKSAGTDGGAPSPTSGSGGSDSPRSIPVCFNCHKPGHRKAECRSGGTPHLTGGNAAPAKFGNRGPIVCHECGEPGHTRPNCPKRSRGNFTRSNGTAQSGNASAAVEKPTIAESDSFLSMNMSQGVRDLVKGVVGGQCVAPVWLNGIESKALWDTGSQVDIISKAHLQDILRKSPERLRKAKCLTVHPPGVSIKDASGKEMPFLGLVQLEIKAQATDPAEMHKFLVQDGPTNFDVVLGTPTLFGSTLFCDQLIQLMKGWNATSRPRAGKDASSNGYCMRIAVESNEWSEVTVTRSCYVRPGSEKTVRLSCGLKDATALLVGDGVSFCDVDADGHLRATVVNSGNNTLCLMKGTKVAECVDAAKVSLEEVEQLAADAGHAMLTRTDGEVAKRASEIYERVLEGSQGKSVLSENKDKVLLLFERFNDCFALSDFELGTTHLFEHEIELAAGTKPIAQPGRPVPLALRKPLKEMLEQYRQMGVIKPSRSDWSSPVVLVRKKDGSIRMCVDYRRLNKVIKLSQYPMPNINVMLQSLVGKKFFTTCDLHSGYWQIPLSPKAKELTAFSTLGGHWEFNVLPFGLSNAPGGFERAMETIFDEELGKSVFIYLDDILIATETLEEHLQVVEKVLSKLREYNLRLKPKKCAFLKTETAFLGHVISSEGLKTDAEKIEKILAFPVPKNMTDVRSFLGLGNYYRQFVKNFTLLSKPIRDVLACSQFHWTEKAQNAFDELKRRMSSTPVLAQPDIEAAISGDKPFILYTDASKDGVGAVLHQVGSDGKEHPIAFASKSCSKAERNYAITDLEALALIYALDKFKYFLLGTHVIARTDHQPLVSLFKRRDLSGRAHRWALEIQEWNNLKIEYIPGNRNVVADALSRNVEVSAEDNTVETGIKSVVMNIQCDETWLAKLKEDGWLKDIFQKPEEEWSSVLKEQDMLVRDGMLYKSVSGRQVLVVPQSEAKAVFERFHNGVFGGHAGWFKTTGMMEKYVYWPRLRRDVKAWVQKCFTCARHKKQRTAVPPLKPIVSTRPYELVGIDVFSISQTSSGVQHVVTVIDHHSKFCAAYAVADKSAETIARAFWENWCLREGRMCSTLLSDRGGEFLNEIMQEIQRLTGVEQKFTVGHNPRENGCTERMNETLKGLLCKMSDGVSEWDQRLAYALFFYNSSPHSTTGESPLFLLHGADPNFPVCGIPSTTVSPYTVDLDGYKVELARGMKALHEITTERMQKQADAMKRYYDQVNKVEKTHFELYDRVFVFNPNVSVDRDSTKLSSPWEGPFRITALSDNSATVSFLGPQKLEKRVQMDYLRKIPPEVADDEFYLYKPDKKVGRPRGPTKKVVEGSKSKVGRPKRAVRFAN
ncbi:gagpol and env protein precursor [Aphelenchoides avenae]|nr:gagpol and env protein precursor [Aphelenchus avenae]